MVGEICEANRVELSAILAPVFELKNSRPRSLFSWVGFKAAMMFSQGGRATIGEGVAVVGRA